MFEIVNTQVKAAEEGADIESSKNINPLSMYKVSIGLLKSITVVSLWQAMACLVLFCINIDTPNDSISLIYQFLSLNIVISSLFSFYIFSHIIYAFIIVSHSFDQLQIESQSQLQCEESAPFSSVNTVSKSSFPFVKVRNMIGFNVFLTVICLIICLIFIVLLFIQNKNAHVSVAIMDSVGLIYAICLIVGFLMGAYYGIKYVESILSVPIELKMSTNINIPKVLHVQLPHGKKDKNGYKDYKTVWIRLCLSLLFVIVFLLTQIGLSFYQIFGMNPNHFDVFLHQFIEIGLNFVFVVMWMMIHCEYYNDVMDKFDNEYGDDVQNEKSRIMVEMVGYEETAAPHNMVAQQAYYDQD